MNFGVVGKFHFPFVPRAHQRVLQDGQLILLVANVVQQPIHQTRRHFRSTDRDGTADRLTKLVTRKARNQVLTFVDSFGQILKL